MKNKISIFILLVILSLSVFANGDDGTTHSGGKSCPPGQTCLAVEPEHGTEAKDDYFFKEIYKFLNSVFE